MRPSQDLSPQSDDEHAPPTYQDHPGRLRGVASRTAGNEGDRRTFTQNKGTIEPILEQRVEQDHRRIKQRIRPMLGFKRFDHASVTISGIELAEKIKKGQFKTGKFGHRKATMSEQWSAALAA